MFEATTFSLTIFLKEMIVHRDLHYNLACQLSPVSQSAERILDKIVSLANTAHAGRIG